MFKNRQQDFRVESNPQLIQEHYIGKNRQDFKVENIPYTGTLHWK